MQIRQPARLIGEEPGAGPGFSSDPQELRVVLGFPDAYEIGISNQAIQILYDLARHMPGVGVERTYLPWTDAISAMRREAIPLLTLETWSPVATADLVGLTLQHELNYTNVLEMLDLAGIPLRREERREGHPLVLGGGPACANFLPMSRFLDAVALGDGEQMFPEILEALAEAKRRGESRVQAKQRLSRIEGVYVPGLSRRVRRRVLSRLEGAPYPKSCLVPLTAAVHDRAWVEVMRGCTRGCRFCQAGMWYRPVRERSCGEVIELAETQLMASGYQELAFGSLSTTDYSGIEHLLAAMAAKHPDVRISLPSLRVDSAAVRLARLASPTGPSLTLAPEAGSPGMRAIINKNVTDADVMAAAEEAFTSGRTTLKLYFMIGLPLEEDADVAAIADLCRRVRDVGRRSLGSRAGRLRLHISVNNFVPKPFTPFQWSGMANRETLLRRQNMLRADLRRPGISLALHSIDKSYLEAALARGGEGLGTVLEEAWRRGARFDSWTEQFKAEAWEQAFAVMGTSAYVLATSALGEDDPLPWDLVQDVVNRDFLLAEWEKAQRAEATGDCRWDVCTACGACKGTRRNDLAGVCSEICSAQAESPVEATCTDSSAYTLAGPRPGACGEGRRCLATFSVTGRGRFVGHLDRTEAFRRAVRRAGGRLALSGGMRPKPLLSMALPLAVGVEGLREMCEFQLAEEPGSEFSRRLAAALPRHMQLLALEPYTATRSLPARVIGATYQAGVTAAIERSGQMRLGETLAAAAARFQVASEIWVEEAKGERVRRINVRKYVEHVLVERGPGESFTLMFRVAVTPAGTARPEHVVDGVGRLAGVQLEIEMIRRTEIHLS